MEEQKSNPQATVISVIVAVGLLGLFFWGRNKSDTNEEKAYEMAVRNGNTMDACVKAGFIKAGYLQDNDESNYKRWKKIQLEACARAGVGLTP